MKKQENHITAGIGVYIVGGGTYIPLRYIAEAVGYEVHWRN
ncbi:MAG: copper amine oxidase N-terminal domain-containing protein [Oscillospiraceae bacterium]|nr:copper amine oxidase N-terminal domain-containing protein [Oscillospiraceae bacterium]